MISNEFIRQATEEYHEESLSAIPTESECDHVFSERFEKNMKSVIQKNKHPQLNRVLRMAASFALVILVAGGSIIALSPTARAAVLGWLFGQEGNVYSYVSMGNDDFDTLIKYDFPEIPEGNFNFVECAVVHQLHLAVGVEGLHLRIVVGGEIQQMLTVVVLAEGHCAVQREMMCLFSVFRHDC